VLVVVEESMTRIQELGVPSDRITVVSNTPPLSRAKAAPHADKQSPRLTLVYMGLMELARGLGTLVDATARLTEQGSNVLLQMIGAGRDLALLQERARILGLGETQVRFHGYIPSHAEALEIVSAADVGVIPHLANDWANTTIPNKLFDYMAAGIPVLTSDSRPCSRIVRETGCGEVFRSGDVDSLVSAVRRLASRENRRRLGAAGISAILEGMNWEADSTRLRNTLEGILKNEGAGADRV
jgi:glycosyltransferase involved in cell wall biosynthesis